MLLCITNGCLTCQESVKKSNANIGTTTTTSNDVTINVNQSDYIDFVSFQMSICIDMVKKMLADEKFALRVEGLNFVVKLFK